MKKDSLYLSIIGTITLIIYLIMFICLKKALIELNDINVQIAQSNVNTKRITAKNDDSKIERETILTRITCYSWTGNKMANGIYPKEGYVASSDRSIKFGTKILIDGVEYEVGDRTAKWVHERFDHPTIDIYKNDCDLSFGSQIKEVIINNNN